MKRILIVLAVITLSSCSQLYDYECTQLVQDPDTLWIYEETQVFPTYQAADDWCRNGFHNCNCVRIPE